MHETFLMKPWTRIELRGYKWMSVLRAAVLTILREHSIVTLLSEKGLIIFTLYPSALNPYHARTC